MYAKVENGVVVKTSKRPKWINEDGTSVSDTILIDGGYYPVTDQPPNINDEYEVLIQNPVEQWSVQADRVEITYMVSDKPLDQRKSEKRGEANRQYNRVIRDGFTFDGGKFSVTDRNRIRMLELVAGVISNKGLPKSKAKRRFRDMAGSAHNLSPQQIVALGAAGSDLIEGAEDRLEELLGQIDRAAKKEDLPSDDEIIDDSTWR